MSERANSPSQVPRWRLLLATAGALVASVAIGSFIVDAGPLLLPTLALAGAGILIHVRSFGAQLLARAVWWANLVLAVFLAGSGGRSEREVGAALALGCGIGLLAAGHKGLAEASERQGYAPVRFKATLLLAMILALADTQTLLLFGILKLHKWHSHLSSTMLLLSSALAMIVAFVGLYRLRTWGLVTNVAANLAIAAAAWMGALHMPNPVCTMLIATAGLQLIVPIPMVLMMVRKQPLPFQPSAQLRSRIAVAMIVTLLLFSLYAGLLHSGRIL